MKKIGLLCLTLVIALGGLGIGYAAWTDQITIGGTVNTGSVNLDVVNYSSTYVYKDLDNDSMVVRYVVTDADGTLIHESVLIPPNGIEIASAVATQAVDGGTGLPIDDAVTFTYLNVFPSVDFVCDVLLHYNGTVPVKFNDISWVIGTQDPVGWFDALVANYDAVGYARMFNDHTIGAVVDVGTQLEYCDLVKVWFTMHLPQNAPMNAEASVTATFEVVQWNEYPHTP